MTAQDRNSLIDSLKEHLGCADDQEVIDRALWHLAGHCARSERLAICKCGLTREQSRDETRIDR
jgi:hypothetical protein